MAGLGRQAFVVRGRTYVSKESIQMLVVYARVLCLQGEAARKEGVGRIDSFGLGWGVLEMM